ncbi:antibiotic biosynthesis monooxygenase [Rhodococcus sp. WMMA185]|uniref:putative quinol monooxygenase n=1 Tax=Rhodococcus sp. WMMA185 TaxID=679318 RepID=UPI000878991A|nr:putative quinol monooxygenase [Rhodococcus sp. WMMA185]AOW92510.1 antibiotic biosynthesis monooxygenase [Rhodococcus sp. WMMA185]
MIFIVVKFNVLDSHRDDWLNLTREFTEATRAEPGNLWYDWSHSVDNPNEYVLVEGFRDAQAGAEHVNSEHFRRGMETMRPALSETPRIINTEIPGVEWSSMGELEITR